METAGVSQNTQDQASPHRVMVVDDNAAESTLYGSGLSEHFTMMFAKSCNQAWDLLNRSPLPDAIILDIALHNEDGLALCEHIKESQLSREIPIIFISALTNASVKAQAFEIGGADFIAKPPVLEELVARIKWHIGIYHKTKRLESLIYIDPLTHLPNASKFQEVLIQEWSRCARYWHHLSLLLIRMDNMQNFKATFGEDEYYSLTASIANDLCEIGCRPGDLFATLGNDVFALLLSDCTVNGADLKADEVMRKFSNENFVTHQQESTRNISCTIAQAVAAPAGSGAAQQLFKIADNLLFETKPIAGGQIIRHDGILGIDGFNSDQHK